MISANAVAALNTGVMSHVLSVERRASSVERP